MSVVLGASLCGNIQRLDVLGIRPCLCPPGFHLLKLGTYLLEISLGEGLSHLGRSLPWIECRVGSTPAPSSKMSLPRPLHTHTDRTDSGVGSSLVPALEMIYSSPATGWPRGAPVPFASASGSFLTCEKTFVIVACTFFFACVFPSPISCSRKAFLASKLRVQLCNRYLSQQLGSFSVANQIFNDGLTSNHSNVIDS